MPRPLPKKISQLKSTLGNVALTSHFAVEFGGLPPQLRRHLSERGINSRYITESIGLLCNSATLPGSSFATADVIGNFTGVAEKFAHTRTFPPVTLNFYVDNGYRSLKFLEHWMEFISSGSETGSDRINNLYKGYYFRMKYPNQYKCDQTRIIKFEKDHKRYIEYRFFGLFPLSLDSTTVSYEGSNLLKATATFQYDRYVSGQSSSLAQFLNIFGNKDGPPSGTGEGSQSTARDYNGVKADEISSSFTNKLLDNGVAAPGASLNGSNAYFNNNNFLNGQGSLIGESRKV